MCAKVYVSDILTYSTDMEAHLQHLDIIISRLEHANMKRKSKQMSHVLQEVKYLGYIITAVGMEPDESHTTAIAAIQTPQTVIQVRAVMGMTIYSWRRCGFRLASFPRW